MIQYGRALKQLSNKNFVGVIGRRISSLNVECRSQEKPDGSYTLNQKHYAEEIPYINIRASRRRERHAPTDDLEKTQLRALLGGVSWYSQQVAPHFSADVSLLLSEVNQSSIDTLYRANRLLDQVRNIET